MAGISTKTIYAVAALHELASIPENEVMKIKEIAARASIPQNFLEQILLELRKQGILTSIKGAHGGYKLAKKLKDVTLKDVIMILETDTLSDICKTDNPALKLFWEDIRVGVLTACGGGGGTPVSDEPTSQELAIDKISQYAENGNSIPTLQDYIDAGITGVTVDNLLQINALIEVLEEKDVDSEDEIKLIVDGYIISLIPEENKVIVELNTSGVNIKSLSGYTLNSSDTQASAGNTDLNLSTEKQDVVVLVDKGGQPIMIGRKYKGEKKVDVSLSSSAEIFVLYSPRFNGVQVSDAKELSSRIRTHQDFPKLIEAVKYAIDTDNPCPLDPICNYQAKEIALMIAGELELDDLYQEEVN